MGMLLFEPTPLSVAVRQLFASGEQGAWYDPSDFSTLYQDAAGTTPVTAVGQYVGKILDKSGRGNHATQSTAASRPTVEARVNLTTNSEGAAATWFASNVVNAATPIDGFSHSLQFGDNAVARAGYKSVTLTTGTLYTTSIFVQMDDGLAPSVGTSNGSGDFCIVSDGFNNTATATVQRISGNIYRVWSARTATIGGAARNCGVVKYTGQSARTFRVIGIQVEEGTTATTYQRVNTATDYVDIGAPRYNALDKTDDHLLVAAGGAGTTGFLLVAGIKVPAAGTARTLWSDRGTNAGYKVGIDASNQIVFSAGNGAGFVSATGPALVAGTKYVITAWHDGANLNVSVNNGAPTQAAFATATAGTATFTIGKSNGAATEYWGDRIYGMIYRNNDTSNTSQRNQAYSYMVGKMGGL